MIIGKVAKFEHNIKCLKLLKTLEEEKRAPTKDERSDLLNYSGWGGIVDVFEQNPQGLWQQRKEELTEVLGSKEEYDSLGNSVLTAYYTPPEFAQKIWTACERLGHRGGAVLEPAAGNGIFLETSPVNNSFTCVEKDTVSAKIAQYVYPEANVYHSGYQDVMLPQNSFDLAISNVPFSETVPIEPKNVATPTVERSDKFNLHNFYFAKTMHGVKEGGLIAFVTSRYTMDSQNTAFRERVAEYCDFVAAIRMPDKTFRSNAGTDVVSDVIFLQKRSPQKDMSELSKSFIQTGEIEVDSQKININKYFIDNPDMIIGTPQIKNFHGKSLNITIDSEKSIYGKFDKLIEKLPQNIKDTSVQVAQTPVYLTQSDDLTLDNDVKTAEGEIHVFNTESGKYEKSELYQKLTELENLDRSVMNRNEKSKQTREMSKIKYSLIITPEFVKMRDLTNEVVQNIMMGNTLKAAQKHEELNKKYDNFVKDFGCLHDSKNLKVFSQYPEYTKVTALEKYNKTTKTGEKSNLLSQVPKFEKTTLDKAQTLEDAYVLSLYNVGNIDVDYIRSLLDQKEYPDNRSIEKGLIEKQLAFPNPERYNNYDKIVFEPAEIALSGNVREKHKEAIDAAQKNEEYFALYRDSVEKAVPKDLLPEEISIRLSSVVLDNEFRQEFVRKMLGDEKGVCRVAVNPNGDFVIIDGKLNTAQNRIENAVRWDGKGNYPAWSCNGNEVLQQILNGSPTKKIMYKIEHPDGSETKALNVPATNAFKQKMNEIEGKFKDWVFNEPERTQKICRKYNDIMNSYVNTEYVHPLRRIDPKTQIRFPNSFFPYPARTHQADAVHRILSSKNTMLAHCVGAGKTYEMITSSMESKRLGISNKPLHVVPNHLLNQYADIFYQTYPQANLLIADAESVKPQQRQEFFNRMALGNYDAIIIKQSSFEKLSVSPEFEEKFIKQELDNLVDFLYSVEDEKSPSYKDTQKRIETLEGKIKNIIERTDADKGNFYFDQMGIDRLYVDEADTYKNLSYITKMENIRGLGSKSGSQQAFDLYMKTQHLKEIGGSIIFATGTPISNSLVEAYTMQKYLQPELLEQQNIKSLDQWASQWAESSKDLELNNTATDYKIVERFSKIVNVPELTTMLRDVWDVKQQDFLIKEGILSRGENLPHLNRKVIAIPSNPLIESYRQYLVEREEDLKGKDTRQKGSDNVLNIMNDGKSAALDMRLISPVAPNLPFSKLNVAADYTYQVYEKTMEEKGAVVIFFDKGTDRKTNFSAFDELKNELILKGIPENEIIMASELDKDDKKQEAFDKINSGEARIIIGTTEKLGAGTNIQERLHTLIHLDIPLRPRDMEQRLGRGDRQGNLWSQVEEVVLLQQGSLDSGLLHLNEIKAGFIGKILSGEEKSRSIEEEAYADMKELSIEDPLMKESMQLRNDIKELKLQQDMFRNNFNVSSREINTLEQRIETHGKILSALKEHKPPTKENLQYNEKNLSETLKLEIDGKNLAVGKEPFKDFRKIMEDKVINPAISQIYSGNVQKTLDLRCQNIDFKIRAEGSFGKLQNLEVSYNANGQEIKNKLASNASGQTVVDKMLETPTEKVAQTVSYIEEQNELRQKELQTHKKNVEISVFPKEREIRQKENRLDVVIKEISQRQNLAKEEHEKRLAELREKGVEIAKIDWSKIEHKTPEEFESIKVDDMRQKMVNLAVINLPEGKNMPEIEVKNSLETDEIQFLKDGREVPKEKQKKAEPLSVEQAKEILQADKNDNQGVKQISEKSPVSKTARIPKPERLEQLSMFEQVYPKKTTEDKENRAIDEANDKFNEDLQRQIKGVEINDYNFGRPGKILLSTGMPDLPILLKPSRLTEKSNNPKHSFDISEIKDLPKAINNPIAVFSYGDPQKAVNIIADIKHEDKHFLVGVSLRPNVNNQKLEINSIRNVFPKDTYEWVNWINQGKGLYFDKDRALSILDQQQIHPADVASGLPEQQAQQGNSKLSLSQEEISSARNIINIHTQSQEKNENNEKMADRISNAVRSNYGGGENTISQANDVFSKFSNNIYINKNKEKAPAHLGTSASIASATNKQGLQDNDVSDKNIQNTQTQSQEKNENNEKSQVSEPVWVKINNPNYESVRAFGDKDDKFKRVYLLTEKDSNVTKISIPGGKISNGKSEERILATSNEIPLKEMRPLIEKQFDDLMAGKPLVYEKANNKTQDEPNKPNITDDDSGPSL